jgi:hypothetical protein
VVKCAELAQSGERRDVHQCGASLERHIGERWELSQWGEIDDALLLVDLRDV